MIKRLYLFLHSSLLAIFTLVVLVFLIVTNSYLVPYFAGKYLSEYGVEYSHIEGSLLNQITIQDVKYKDFLKLKSLRVEYNFFYLLRETPTISNIAVERLELNLNNMPASDANSSSTSNFAFFIQNIELKRTHIVSGTESVEFDIKAKDLYYKKQIDIANLHLDVETSYAHVTLNAKVLSNKIIGDISLKDVGIFATSPIAFKFDVESNDEKVIAKIDADSLILESNAEVNLKDMAFNLEYLIAQKELHAQATYNFISPDYKTGVKQTLHVTTLGGKNNFVTDVDAGKTKIHATATLDSTSALKMEGKLLATNPHVTLNMSYKMDEKNIALQTKIKPPKIVQKNSQLSYEYVDINTTLAFGESMEIQNNLYIPWVAIKTDSQNRELVKNIFISALYADKKLKVQRYSAEYMEQKIYSEKESLLSLDANSDIIFDEFWIYDNLLLKGKVKTADKSVDVTLQSEQFNYVADDANVTLKADLHLLVDANGSQSIKGDVMLLNGVVSYVTRNDYKISDKDIIILQDIKKKESSKRFVDINITSKEPIRYKTEEIDVGFTPEIRVVEKPEESLKLYGDVTIGEGMITTEGKEFKIDPSYVRFNGEEELNPNINIHLHYYTLDYIDIEIFITHTLLEPIVIFSSNPAMSQNDIMSYILFGERANAIFDGSSNKTSVNALLLGTGLSQMFRDTSGINIDTLNILNNQNGTLGYEVGARFNKNMRVVYKSNTTSSVVLQYSISRSVRFDVDTHETGQGVGFVYVKDFSIH